MTHLECPYCWTLMEAQSTRKAAECPVCATLVEPEDFDEVAVEARGYRRPRGDSPYRVAWKRTLWGAFSVALAAAIGLVVFARLLPQHQMVAVWCGAALVALGVLLVPISLSAERKTSPTASRRGAVENAMRWPQSFLTLSAGVVTIVAALVANSPPGSEIARTPTPATGNGNDPPVVTPPITIPGIPSVPGPLPTPARFKPPPAANSFDGLLAYWSLDEGIGNRAFDSRNRLEATATGGQWVAGARGKALRFNGTSDFLDLGDWPDLNLPADEAFTLACWVAPESKTGTVFWFRSDPDGLAILGVQVIGGKLRAWVRQDGGIFHPQNRKGELVGTTPLDEGEWHHVALTRRVNGEIELYHNGRSVGRTKGQDTSGKLTTNARALGMDLHAWRSSPKNPEVTPLKGSVDEFCVFSRALSALEIAKLAGREP